MVEAVCLDFSVKSCNNVFNPTLHVHCALVIYNHSPYGDIGGLKLCGFGLNSSFLVVQWNSWAFDSVSTQKM